MNRTYKRAWQRMINQVTIADNQILMTLFYLFCPTCKRNIPTNKEAKKICLHKCKDNNSIKIKIP